MFALKTYIDERNEVRKIYSQRPYSIQTLSSESINELEIHLKQDLRGYSVIENIVDLSMYKKYKLYINALTELKKFAFSIGHRG